MPDLVVDLYTEDAAQEAFLSALVERVVGEAGHTVRIRSMTVRGGLGRVKSALIARQGVVRKGQPHPGVPDLLVVGRDGDGGSARARRAEVREWLDPAIFPRFAIAVPNPYVERWFILDEAAFARVTGVGPPEITSGSKTAYKDGLEQAIEQSGVETLLPSGYDLAPEIVSEISLYKCGKSDAGFKHFVDDIRSAT